MGLLAESTDFGWLIWVVLGLLVVGLVLMMVFSRRRAKKQEQDTADLINAVKPGNKVKTIGGICGVVVEVDNEENTFVLETGTEQSGKCCIKFDKQAIYQTDAVVEKPDKKADKDGAAEGEAQTEGEATDNAEPAEPFVVEGEEPQEKLASEEPAEPAEAKAEGENSEEAIAEAAESAPAEQKPSKKKRNKK